MDYSNFTKNRNNKQIATSPSPQEIELLGSLDRDHLEELQESAIHPDIAALNCRSFRGDEIYPRFFAGTDIARASGKRQPDAQWRWLRRHWGHLEGGGLLFEGIDPESGEEMAWCRVKPRQRKEPSRKYEAPPRADTRMLFFRIDWKYGLEIARKSGLGASYLNRMEESGITDSTLDSEDREFWKFAIDNPSLKITITEGEKKALSLISHGYAAIAIPGIWMAIKKKSEYFSSSESAVPRPDLLAFLKGDRTIFIAFDEDIKDRTRHDVMRAASATAKWISKAGENISARILRWEPWQGKGIDDFIANKGDIDKLFQRSRNWYLAKNEFQLYELSGIRERVSQRYLSLSSEAESARFLALKSPKGTGKTEAISREIKRLKGECWDKDLPILVAVHRRQLAAALAGRFGINDKDSISDIPVNPINVGGYALCIDSLHEFTNPKFKIEDWESIDPIVVIDEAEQVIDALVSGRTEVAKRRTEIIENLGRLLHHAYYSGSGKIIIADADLSNISIRFLCDIAGIPLPHIIENHWIEKGKKCFCYRGNSPIPMMAALRNEVSENGAIPLMLFESAKPDSKWTPRNAIEFLKDAVPELNSLELSAHTVGSREHEAFAITSSINERIIAYGVVAATPTLETGISIDVRGHFDSKWLIAWGIRPEWSVRQMAERLRENVPLHIWINDEVPAAFLDGNGEISPYKVGASEIKKGKQSLAKLKPGIKNKSLDFQSRKAAQEQQCIEQLNQFDEDRNWNNFDFMNSTRVARETWNRLVAKKNIGKQFYREFILEKLELDGYEVSDAVYECLDEEFDEVKEKFKILQEKGRLDDRSKKANAPDIEDSEFEQLESKNGLTDAEYYKKEKHKIKQKYCVGEVSEDLAERDANGFYGKLKLHYWLSVGREGEDEKARHIIENQHQKDGAIYLPDANIKNRAYKVAALEKMGINEVLAAIGEMDGGEFTEDLPAIRAFHDQFLEWGNSDPFDDSQVGDILKIGVRGKNRESPIAVVRGALALLGIEVEYSRRVRLPSGKRKKAYRFIIPEDGRFSIFDRWMERDRKLIEKWEAEKSEDQEEGRIQRELAEKHRKRLAQEIAEQRVGWSDRDYEDAADLISAAIAQTDRNCPPAVGIRFAIEAIGDWGKFYEAIARLPAKAAAQLDRLIDRDREFAIAVGCA